MKVTYSEASLRQRSTESEETWPTKAEMTRGPLPTS